MALKGLSQRQEMHATDFLLSLLNNIVMRIGKTKDKSLIGFQLILSYVFSHYVHYFC